MENYYEKYGFSRDFSKQKSFLFEKIEEAKKFCEKHEFNIKNLEKDLENAKIQGNKESVDEITQVIESEKKNFVHYSELLLEAKKADILDERSRESFDKKEKITDMYFSSKLYDVLVSMRKEFEEVKKLPIIPERREKSTALSKKLAEYMKMKPIFNDSLKRKKYDTELELYLKYKNNGDSNREARISGQRQYIRTILGKDFNPDMSSQLNSKDKFDWKVKLYEEPKKLFVGKSNYPEMPQNNQEIYAYSFGTFEFDILPENYQNLFFKNSSCEIIGVTKKSADGFEDNHLLIAPTRFLSGIKNIEFMDEYTPRRKIKSQDTLLSRISKQGRKMLERVFGEESKPKKNKKTESFKRKIVIIPEEKGFSDEQSEFLANVYFSDYLIDNARKNNASFLGNYVIIDGKQVVSFEMPMDDLTIRACNYAKTNEGIIQFNQGVKSKTERISNIEELFDVLSIKQCVLASQERKKQKADVQKQL